MPNEPIIDLSILNTEPADEYHAKAAEFLSSHQLMDFMRCPYLHAKKRAGLITGKESPAYLIGRAAHCRILEGRDVYESEFALDGAEGDVVVGGYLRLFRFRSLGEDEDGLFADFHANRHTFISNLGRAVAQSLARHSDINLTMNIYTHLGVNDQASAVNDLPSPPPVKQAGDAEAAASTLQATGTDGGPGPEHVQKHVHTTVSERRDVQQSREEMEVLFTLLAERYERGSVMLTSNLPFSKWEAIFKDPMTTAAAIDRLVHHSVILELNLDSYRLERAKQASQDEKAVK